ncbi:MAG: sugar phosphate isomerase/epimerase [Oscillospiraceae bacterium]
MQISFSNIGFAPEDDTKVYKLLKALGYTGVEIAPSRFVGDAPYDKLDAAAQKRTDINREYGFVIPSMQSIWYGMQGNIFIKEDALRLMEYSKKAVSFAKAISCKSLVFGCPKNRNIPVGAKPSDAEGFFCELAQYAFDNGTAIALEANPSVYGTNFINTSKDAFAFAKNIPHLKVNYDFGTFITNEENLDTLYQNLDMVSHVHISEPSLACITKRKEHKELAALLESGGYKGFVSVEMARSEYNAVETAAEYIAEVFAK